MSNTNSTSEVKSKSPAARKGDMLGKTSKSHDVFTITADRVAILGIDIKSQAGLPDGVWLLCDVESNLSEPSAELMNSIANTRKVSQPIKTVRVPVTPEIAEFEYHDDAGRPQGFVLIDVWGRHRIRAVRAVQGDEPIRFRAIVAAKNEKFDELALEALVENVVRRAMAPTREAAQLGNLRDGGLSVAEIARRVGAESGKEITAVTIHNKLSLLNLGQSIADMVDSGKIGVTHAYVIAKAPAAHHARLAADALDGQTVDQLKRTVRELADADKRAAQASQESQQPTAGETPTNAPEANSDQPNASSEPPAGNPAPNNQPPAQPSTRTKRPKAAAIAEMIERLAGDEPHMAAAREALRYVQGEQTDEQLMSAIAALMGKPFPAKPAPTNPDEKPEA